VADKIRRTLLKAAVHLANLISDLVGDDVVGKAVRRATLRLMGSHVGSSTSIHGRCYFSWPAHLSVGDRVFVNRNCYFDLEARIVIEDDATIGHGATLITTVHDMSDPLHRAGRTSSLPITVARGSWLGAGCTVLPGITIGPGAVVAAGAVVTHDVGADALVAGVPARFLRTLGHGDPALDLSSFAGL
jgi:maltose O-acetyltransferase